MGYNGSGSFSLAQSPFVTNTTILSAVMNSNLSDIASNGLSKCVTVDGQNPILGQLKFPNGTAAAPSHSFATDPATGMYYGAAKKLAFSAGGTAAIFMDLNNQGSGQNGNTLYYNSPSGTTYLCPVGSCVDYAGATAPAGWLLCFGQVLNISSYPELGGLLGATYGGNGSTTFGVPDYRGRTSYGKDNMGGSAANRITVAGGNYDGTVLGNSGGAQNHTLSSGEMPAHAHTGTGNVSDPQHTHSLNNATNLLNGNPGAILFNTNGQGVALTSNATSTGITVPSLNINNAGGGGSHTILGPAIIFNKIIFAGRV